MLAKTSLSRCPGLRRCSRHPSPVQSWCLCEAHVGCILAWDADRVLRHKCFNYHLNCSIMKFMKLISAYKGRQQPCTTKCFNIPQLTHNHINHIPLLHLNLTLVNGSLRRILLRYPRAWPPKCHSHRCWWKLARLLHCGVDGRLIRRMMVVLWQMITSMSHTWQYFCFQYLFN
jgi:hypothetical protein